MVWPITRCLEYWLFFLAKSISKTTILVKQDISMILLEWLAILVDGEKQVFTLNLRFYSLKFKLYNILWWVTLVISRYIQLGVPELKILLAEKNV